MNLGLVRNQDTKLLFFSIFFLMRNFVFGYFSSKSIIEVCVFLFFLCMIFAFSWEFFLVLSIVILKFPDYNR